ncbi:MAG: hypothetical protein WC554_00385 [Clostridia bacterium]|jgi:uncharacterized protein Smg (DUF494 family)
MNEKINNTKILIERFFEKGTKSLRDYEQAKQLIQIGFTPQEYEELIKFITDYIGV